MNLPNVFQNNKINTNKVNDLYYSKIKQINKNTDINNKINNIFKSKSYVYKIDVIITTKDETYQTTIIGKKTNYLITLDNKLINIKDIIDIKTKPEE